MSFCPVTFWIMADNIKVPSELYKNTVPGLFTMGVARNPLTQFLFFLVSGEGSGNCPSDMISTSFTVSAARFGEIVSGRSFGKNEMTLSDNLILFSATAKPMAVAVNVLLAEYTVWRRSFLYGFHHPSAM